MIVYLARDIPAFVMFCGYGESRSSLLIESTDSMIYLNNEKRLKNLKFFRDTAAKKSRYKRSGDK